MGFSNPVTTLRGFFPVDQVARFILFSGVAAVANIGSGYLLYTLLGFKTGWRYGISVALAFLVGMGVSFTLNRSHTFAPSGRRLHKELLTFFLVSLGGLLLTVALSNLLRGLLLTRLPDAVNPELAAHAVAVGLVALYSFTAHKLFSFGRGIRNQANSSMGAYDE